MCHDCGSFFAARKAPVGGGRRGLWGGGGVIGGNVVKVSGPVVECLREGVADLRAFQARSRHRGRSYTRSPTVLSQVIAIPVGAALCRDRVRRTRKTSDAYATGTPPPSQFRCTCPHRIAGCRDPCMSGPCRGAGPAVIGSGGPVKPATPTPQARLLPPQLCCKCPYNLAYNPPSAISC